MKELYTTLLHVIKDGKILLAEKKRGFGQGLLNGVGGKVEPDETIEEAMIREAKEEIGIIPINYKKRGLLVFEEFFKGEQTKVFMSIYTAYDYLGEPTESDEMKPIWVSLNQIPYEKMFEDDKFWLKHVIEGRNFVGSFIYDKNFNLLYSKIVKENWENTYKIYFIINLLKRSVYYNFAFAMF